MISSIKSILATCLFLLATTLINAQVGIGTASPNASARLQVDANSSTNAKGFLPPRVTLTERVGITTPAAGLMVYQTDGTAGLYFYNGSAWIYIMNSTSSTLAVNNGGTGSTNLDGVLIGNGTNAVTAIAPGASGNLLISNGSSWTSQASNTLSTSNNYSLSNEITTNTNINTLYDYYLVNTSAAPITITLPDISSLSASGYKAKLTIVDIGGEAINNNIIILSSGGNIIAGGNAIIINSNYSRVTLLAVHGAVDKWFVL